MTGVDNCSSAARDNCSTTRRTVLGGSAGVAATFALSTYTNELLALTPARGLPSTIEQAGDDLRSGSSGVTELVQACLDGAKQVGPNLNPFITLNEDEALADRNKQFGSSSMPVGLQIVANDFQEQPLFRIAAALEGVTEFHSRRPQIYWDGCA